VASDDQGTPGPEQGSACDLGPIDGKAGDEEAAATALEERMKGSGTLKRALSLFFVYIIATGAIFTFMGYWDGYFLTATGPFTFLTFGILTIAVLPIAYVYAEWAAMAPTCGVELVYGTLGLNKHWGFISTWFILAAWLAVPPAGTLGIIEWLNYMFDWNMSIGWIAFIAIIVLCLLTFLSLYEIRLAGEVQTVMMMYAFLMCVVGAIIWMSSAQWSFDNFSPFVQTGFGDGNKSLGLAIGIAMLITPYFGFEIVPNMVEEGTFPIKKMNRAIIGCVVTCGALYVLYFFALTGMANWDTLTGGGTSAPFVSLDQMKVVVGTGAGGTAWLWLFSIGVVLFPIAASILGFWLSSVRMLYAAGRQNFLPKVFAKTNKHHQPIVPNVLILALSIIAIITMNYSNFLATFFALMAFCVAVCYTIICTASIRTAIKHPEWERPYKIPGGMFMRVLALLISVVIAVLTAWGQPGWIQMAEYLGVGFALWMWMVFVKWRKEKVWMEGPEGVKDY